MGVRSILGCQQRSLWLTASNWSVSTKSSGQTFRFFTAAERAAPPLEQVPTLVNKKLVQLKKLANYEGQ